MIPVTKPFLPPQAAYQSLIDGVWERNWLTNNGPLVNELELKLKEHLGLSHLLFVGNGTIALQLAIKALGLKGDIITTPFSYVATTSSIVWENCRPVFADIDPHTLNIDPVSIEAAITPDTEAILATHCFGNACEVERIAALAERHQLKVIYDAAHCFGTTYKDQSIFNYGDISTVSFHATKLYHTVEGGAVCTPDAELLKTMAYMRNFGHDGPERFHGVGINGKNSEFHAAMGLAVLPHVEEILEQRKTQCLRYDALLENMRIERPTITEGCGYNYAYYPVLFESEDVLLKVESALKRREIFPRRYFYPSLSSLEYVPDQETPVCDDIAKRVLCLPLYHTLSEAEQRMIARILLTVQRYG